MVASEKCVAPSSRHSSAVCSPFVRRACGDVDPLLDRRTTPSRGRPPRPTSRICSIVAGQPPSSGRCGKNPSASRAVRRSARSAEPPIQIGNRPLHGQRVDAGRGDRVPAAVVVEHGLRPQAPHELDLLLEAAAAIVEVHAQRLVLDGIPADAEPEAEAAAREHVDLRRLLRQQRRLPLRRDDDAGDELETRRHAREIAEERRGSRGTCARCGTGPTRSGWRSRPPRARGRRRGDGRSRAPPRPARTRARRPGRRRSPSAGRRRRASTLDFGARRRSRRGRRRSAPRPCPCRRSRATRR